MDKKIASDLDYKGIEFPVSKKGYRKMEQKNNIWINVFCHESDLLNRSQHVYIKILTVLCSIREKKK